MTGDGPVVGKVSIKVKPDTKGFRQQVQKDLASLKELDVRLKPEGVEEFRKKVQATTKGLTATVNAKLDAAGLRSDAKAAAAAASGQDVLFDALLLDHLDAQAAKAAKKASRHAVRFRVMTDQASLGSISNALGSAGGNRSIKLDVKAGQFQTMSAEVGRMNSLLRNTRGLVRKLTTSLSISSIKSSEGFKKTAASIRKVASVVRAVIRPAEVLFKTLKWASGGYWIEGKLLNWLTRVRDGASKAGKAVGSRLGRGFQIVRDQISRGFQVATAKARQFGSALYGKVEPGLNAVKNKTQQVTKAFKTAQQGAKTFLQSFKHGDVQLEQSKPGARDGYDSVRKQVAELKKLDGAKAAFNRRSKKYNAELHDQWLKLNAQAKELRLNDPFGTSKKLPEITNGIKQIARELGATEDQFDKITAATDKATKAHKRYRDGMKARDRQLRFEAAVERVKTPVKKVTNKVTTSFDNSKAGAAFREMQKDIAKATEKVKQLKSVMGKLRAPKLRFGSGDIDRETKRLGNFRRALGSTWKTALLGKNASNGVRGSFASIRNAMKSTQAASNKTGLSFSKMWSKLNTPKERTLGLTRMGWIIAGIGSIAAPAVGLVAGALAALPALGFAAAAALGATMLGMDGIKEAANAAAPAFNELKAAMSDTFQERLTPQFEQLSGVIKGTQSSMVGVANGMADFSQGFVDALSSTRGMSNLNSILGNTGNLFSKLQPFAHDFTAGLLELGAAGSRSFDNLGERLNNFGSTFKASMQEMSDNGTIQKAVESTYAALGAFGNAFGQLFRAGLEQMPVMEQSIVRLFEMIGNGASAAMPMLANLFNGVVASLDFLTSAMGPTFQALFSGLGDIFTGIAPGVQALVEAFAPISETIVSGVTGMLSSLAPLFNNIAQNVSGMVTAMQGPIQGLMDMLQGVFDYIGQNADVFGPIITAVGAAAGAFALLMPVVSIVMSVVGAIRQFGLVVSLASALLPLLANPIGLIVAGVVALGAALVLFFTQTETGQQAWNALKEAFSSMAQGIMPALSAMFDALKSTLMGLWQAVQPLIPVIGTVLAAAFQILMSIISAVAPLIGALVGFFASLVGAVLAVVGALMPFIAVAMEVVAAILQVIAVIITLTVQALAAVIGWVANMIAAVVNFVSQWINMFTNWVNQSAAKARELPGRVKSALGNLGSMLLSSGKALIQGFIDGILSMLGKVADAARSVVQAARDFFPFSPAKKGPFSGRGYTTYSGKALAKDFAEGMLSEKGTVAAAAEDVAATAQKHFSKISLTPLGHQIKQVQAPVREENAKKVADWRKKDAELVEKFNEDKIKNEEEYLKDREKLLERERKLEEDRAQARKDMEESIETPDYGEIDLSPNALGIQGMKTMLTENLATAWEGTVDVAKQGALSMIDAARAALKSNPELEKISRAIFPALSAAEIAIQTEVFSDAIANVIRTSKIAEIPIDFAVANLDQVRSELGMGDGVVSRAIDEFLGFNLNNSDTQRFKKDQGDKGNVHYHVADMNEAIRLENQRTRKSMMKM